MILIFFLFFFLLPVCFYNVIAWLQIFSGYLGWKKNLEHYKQTHLKETYWSVLGGKCFHMHGAALSISKTDNHFKDITSKRSVWNRLNILVWPWWSLHTVTGGNLLTSSFLCLWNANLALWHEASLKASPVCGRPKAGWCYAEPCSRCTEMRSVWPKRENLWMEGSETLSLRHPTELTSVSACIWKWVALSQLCIYSNCLFPPHWQRRTRGHKTKKVDPKHTNWCSER